MWRTLNCAVVWAGSTSQSLASAVPAEARTRTAVASGRTSFWERLLVFVMGDLLVAGQYSSVAPVAPDRLRATYRSMDGTIDLERVALFLTVAETAGFSAAAKKLGLPKSSVSRQVAALEAALGTQLLHRTTRRVSLSTAGEALYERAAPLVVALRAALGSLPEQEEQASGELRITAPNDVGASLLGDI